MMSTVRLQLQLQLVIAVMCLTGFDAPDLRLEAAWRALHPGQSLPAPCAHPDPVRTLVLDGETALASLRLGVVLLAADGKPLASLPLGCVEGRGADERAQVISIESLRARGEKADLVIRARRVGHCGWASEWLLLSRAKLERLLSVDEEGERGCGAAPVERWKARVELLAPGRLRFRNTEYRLRDGKFVRAD